MNVPSDNLPPPLSGRVGHARPTTYEIASIVSARSAMLANGAPAAVYPGVTPEHSPIDVARRELAQGVLPISIQRHVGTDKGLYTIQKGGTAAVREGASPP